MLPTDYLAVHEVCRLFDPRPDTREGEHPVVRTALAALFGLLVERPELRRALRALPDDKATRVAALTRVWMDGNAFEHVFCGEENRPRPGPSASRLDSPNQGVRGTVGGMHLWSEYYLAERAGRATYECSLPESLSDPAIATVRHTWRPETYDTALLKPVGGFHVGMTPACLLAVGYLAQTGPCPPSPDSKPGAPLRAAITLQLYERMSSWVYWRRADGSLLTVFPLAGNAAW